ncbi:MAG: translation initiation factor IF-2 [Candidatus Heimdallarchaeota archaeon]|nr:translation initiation factor IF-2 [Candidatus Heimdallarchaeota archaeon]
MTIQWRPLQLSKETTPAKSEKDEKEPIIQVDENKRLKAPICVILGHIDHGKTSILDAVRGTAVQAREAGGITQQIGASYFPIETILEICGDLMSKGAIKLKLPGILIVDTPGHAAFLNLRTRGASVADIAIVVVDVQAGFQPQTFESMRLLRQRKIPFLIAANKIDRVAGWKMNKGLSFGATFKLQTVDTQKALDNHIYELMGELSKLNYPSDRYDRIRNYTEMVGIVPTSAKTHEGIQDLFLVLSGLAQQFLLKKLVYSEGPGIGTILEVTEEAGLGTTLNVIIHSGTFSKNDRIVFGGKDKAYAAKIRSLLQPKELDEIRDPREKFNSIDLVHAAAGIKITASGLNEAVAGAPIMVANTEEEIRKAKILIEEEISDIKIDADREGIIIKADTLGALEALVKEFRDRKIPIKIADIGDVSKANVTDAIVVKENAPAISAIVAFNVGILPDAQEEQEVNDIPFFRSDIIYTLLDDYQHWKIEMENKLKAESLKDLIRPGKFKIIPGMVFRANKPAIVGVEVLAGKISPRVAIIRGTDGKKCGSIQQIQENNQAVKEAGKGKEVAVSIRGPTVGRQITEEMVIFVDLPESVVRKIKSKYYDDLTIDEKEALEELIALKRSISDDNKFWGY